MKKLLVGVFAACAAAVSFAEDDWTGEPDYYVEYLQSTPYDNQWIDTGVPAKSPFKVDAVLELGASGGEYCFLACREITVRFYALYSSGGNWVSGYGADFYGTGKAVPGAQTGTAPGVKYSVQTEMKNGSQTLIVNDKLLYDQKGEGDFEVAGKTFPIFAGTDASGNISYHTPAKCYSCKMWQGGELKRNFCPCVKNGEPCLYDLVTKTYFRNQTARPFQVGSRIELMKISAIPSQEYTGQPIEPPVTVSFLGETLDPETDYEVSYANNTEVGMATVTVVGKGELYEGLTARSQFLICVPNAFSVKDPQGVDVGGYSRFTEAFAACLSAGGGEIVLKSTVEVDAFPTPTAQDLDGKTVLIRPESGSLFRLLVGAAGAGTSGPSADFTLQFKDVLVDGEVLAWVDQIGRHELVQGKVFEVQNGAGGEWVGYDSLAAAASAASAGGIVELVADAFYDGEVTITKNLTIRSRGANRRTLRRFGPGEIRVKQATDNLNTMFTVTMTNLVVDGGAVWTKPDTLADASGIGVTGGRFARIGNGGASSPNAWLELRDMEVVNFRFDPDLFQIDATCSVVFEKGARVHNCRQNLGGALFRFPSGNGSANFSGGEVSQNFANYIYNAVGTAFVSFSTDAGALTGNVVRMGFYTGGDYARLRIGRVIQHDWAEVSFRSEPGRFLLKDNVMESGAPIGFPGPANYFQIFVPLDPASVFQVSLPGELGAACALVKSDGNSRAGDTNIQFPWVIENTDNPILRGEVVGTDIVWAQKAVVGRTADIAAKTALSGSLRIVGVEPLDESVGRTAGYTLFTCAAGFTGAFESFTLDDNLITKESHRAYWKLQQSANEVRLVYRGPGLVLIVR